MLLLSSKKFSKSFRSFRRSHVIQKTPCGAFFVFYVVAGTRFARMPTGYEPVEVLLLQPAMIRWYTFFLRKARFRNIVSRMSA